MRPTTICALGMTVVPAGPEPERVITSPRGAGIELRLAAVGDVDADGRADYLVAHATDSRHVHRGGSVQLVSGASGRILFEKLGQRSNEQLGGCIDGPGDVDADGIPDLLVSSFVDARLVRIEILTTTGRRLHAFELSRVPDAWARMSAAGAGDVNGDGHADVVLCESDGTGVVRSGKDGAALFALASTENGEALTPPVGAAGDVDGDGRVDVFAWTAGQRWIAFSGVDGRRLADWQGIGHSGCFLDDVDDDGWREVALGCLPEEGAPEQTPTCDRVRVVSGRTGAELFHCEDDRQGILSDFGASLARVTDLDGDGFADLVVGAPDHEDANDDDHVYANDFGRIVVFSGRDGRILGASLGPAQDTKLGRAVLGLGDLDGDGASEVAAFGWENGRRTSAWFVFSGAELAARSR